MRYTCVLLVAILLIGSAAFAQFDPGARDSVIVGRPGQTIDTVQVGRSTPIPVKLVTDDLLDNISIPLKLETIDGGFIRMDSVSWRGPAASPLVLAQRIIPTFRIDESSPDTILIALLHSSPPSFEYPPSSEYLCDIYFTGLTTGSLVIDTSFWPPVIDITLLVDNGLSNNIQVSPAFSGATIEVVEGLLPPVLDLPDNPPFGAIGSQLTFDAQASSPEALGTSVTLSDIEGWDDPGRSPISQPVASGSNPTTFTWSPTSSLDIGVWRATISACDDSGYCTTREIQLQVVDDPGRAVAFDVYETPNAEFSKGIVHGDFDEDNQPELAVLGWPHQEAPALTSYEFNGGAPMQKMYDFDDDLPKRAMQVAYLSDDTLLDIIVAGWSTGFGNDERVMLFRGDGTNQFQMTVDEQIPSLVRSMTLGDFNGDAYVDIATGGPSGVHILAGSQTGQFSVINTFYPLDSTQSLNSADFDMDGDDDLAIGTPQHIRIYLNDGTGSFSAGAIYQQQDVALDVEVTNSGADFNSDGKFDLTTSAPSITGSSSIIYLYLGNGDGTFAQSEAKTVVGQTVSVQPADVDGDANLDIVYTNLAGDCVGILFGNGTGSFVSERRLKVPSFGPQQMDCLDIDLDGDLDIVVNSHENEDSASTFIFENLTDPSGIIPAPITVHGLDDLDVTLSSASGKQLSRVGNSFSSGSFYDRNLNANAVMDEQLTVYTIENGAYELTVAPEPGVAKSGGTFSLEFEIGGELYRLAQDEAAPSTAYTYTIYPGGASPISPRQGSFVYNEQPLLDWPGTGDYQIQIATDLQFTNIVVDQSVSESAFTPSQPLTVVDTAMYFWHVRQVGTMQFGETNVVNIVSSTRQANCGNIDADPQDMITISDLVYLVSYMFGGGPAPQIPASADMNGLSGVDIGDLNILVAYMFGNGVPPACPGL